MFEIIVLRNGIEQGRYALHEPVSILGRADGNQIVLPEDSVSRRHAQFLSQNQKLYLEDLRSGNGTYVHGQRIDRRLELNDGDEIHIAPFTLKVRVLAPAVAPGAGVETDQRTAILPSLVSSPPPQAPQLDPTRTGARLILRRGEAGKSSYTIASAQFTIGRSEDRDVILTDPASSRRHATLQFMGDHYYIRDEGSANGILINNVPLREGRLNHGDRLIVGETEFEFLWPNAPRIEALPGYAAPPPLAPGMAAPMPTPAMTAPPPMAPAFGAPQAPVGAPYGAIDPYSETGIMPTNYPGWQQPGAPAGMPYTQGGGYGVELGAPPVKRRNPLRLVAVAAVVLLFAAIGIKTVMDRGQTTETANAPQQTDPCAAFQQTCEDPTDMVCLNCLNKRTRLSRGQELFGQKEFSQAVEEFQRILQDIDPVDEKATRFRYISYEFWVLTAMDETLRDRSQTVAQKMQQSTTDLARAKEIYERYGRASYTKDTPESTLAAARAQLGEAVSLANAVLKVKVDDPAVAPMREEAEQLRSRALGQIGRLKVIKQASAQEAFVQGVQTSFDEAMALKASGNMTKAAAKFRQVIEKDPQDKTSLASQARAELETINRAQKDRAKPLYNEALTRIRNEQWIEARSKLQEALRIDPNLEEAKAKLTEVNAECESRAKKLFSEAKIQLNVGNYTQAEKLLKQVLLFVPDKSDDTHQKAQEKLASIGRNN